MKSHGTDAPWDMRTFTKGLSLSFSHATPQRRVDLGSRAGEALRFDSSGCGRPIRSTSIKARRPRPFTGTSKTRISLTQACSSRPQGHSSTQTGSSFRETMFGLKCIRVPTSFPRQLAIARVVSANRESHDALHGASAQVPNIRCGRARH